MREIYANEHKSPSPIDDFLMIYKGKSLYYTSLVTFHIQMIYMFCDTNSTFCAFSWNLFRIFFQIQPIVN